MTTPPHIFSLANQSLKLDSAEATTPHLSSLRSSPEQYTEIRLNGNTLGIPACQSIAEILPSLVNLETANLADIYTGRLLSEIPTALSALLTALLRCSKLHTIDLSDNAFGLNTVAPLVAYLKEAVSLRHLILNNNGLGPNAGAMIAEALEELAERKEKGNHPPLETIVCGRNRLESGSMAAWAKAFGRHGGVRTVKMVQNGIRSEGIVTLLREGLKGCFGLQILDLQDNTFTGTGSKALADVVGGWGGLKELGVGDCLLGGRGSELVFGTLGKGGNKELQVLRFTFNEVDGKGLDALLGALNGGGLEGIRKVELNGNKFSEDDVRVLKLREVLEDRRTAQDGEEDDWGVDSLSDMEESDDDEEDEEEDEEVEKEKEEKEESKAKGQGILREAEAEENAPVTQKKDAEVDDLAAALDKTL
jgi:Ran GTPase-activating protein 1